MTRREFIALLVGAGVPLFRPLAARVQQTGELPIIGFLAADASSLGPWTAAFVARLTPASLHRPLCPDVVFSASQP